MSERVECCGAAGARNGARSRNAEESGFTLIELMVVILIIGTLISIALPTFLGARTRAQDRATQSDLRTAIGAATTHWAQLGNYDGFTAVIAEQVEPSITWVSPGPPVEREVAIEAAAGGELLLVAVSGSGRYFCLAQLPGSPVWSRGSGTAHSDVDEVLECVGGW